MPIIANNTLRVDQNTTMRQLEELMNRDDKAKIYGRKDEGVITLYTSNKKSSTNLIDRMTGRAAKRRQLGRDGLQEVFRNATTSLKNGKQGLADKLFQNIRKGINPKEVEADAKETDAAKIKAAAEKAAKVVEMKTHAVRAGDIKKYLDMVSPAADKLSAPVEPAPKVRLKGLSLKDAGMANKLGLLREVAGRIETAEGDGLQELAEKFGDKIEASYRRKHPSAGSSEDLALSGGARMRQGLAAKLRSLLGGAGLDEELEGKIDSFVDAAVNRASTRAAAKVAAKSGSFLGKAEEGDKRSIPGKDGVPRQVSPIVIGGKTYIPEEHLAQGGYGDVFLMRNDEGHAFAYKLPLPFTGKQNEIIGRRQENLDAGAAEIAAHKKAAAKPHPNVLGLRGAVRTEDGRLGIVLDFVPNGDLYALGEKIRGALAAGTISQASADAIRMTLVKDMAEGLKHLHANRVTHYDLKAPNCMIDADGRVKIGDFGESFVDDKADVFSLRTIANPIFKAPDILVTEKRGKNDFKQAGLDAGEAAGRSAILHHFEGLFPFKPGKGWDGKTPEQKQSSIDMHNSRVGDLVDAAMARIEKPQEEAAKAARSNDYEVTNKVDVWGLGMAALELFNGAPWNEHMGGFKATTENALIAFADPANGGNPALSTTSATAGNNNLFDGSLLPATSFAEGNALVNDLLVASPSARPGMDRVVGHAAFSAPGVGTPEASLLLKALLLKDDDPTRSAAIEAANAALTDVVIASYSPLGTVVQA